MIVRVVGGVGVEYGYRIRLLFNGFFCFDEN